MRPRLLDAFCGAGGCTKGYQRAGFHVTGVDINPQPRYCGDEFIQADALEFIAKHGHKFDAIHASTPCQLYTNSWRIQQREHPDLVGPVRELLERWGGLYVLENVPGAPLIDPIVLCGSMFPELNVYRHRLFETNFPIEQPHHPEHRERQTKMGRPPVVGERIQVVGNFSGVEEGRRAMGIDWMTRNELSESVPPAYTEWIGERLMVAGWLEAAA